MVQQDLQSPAGLTETQGIITGKFFDSGNLCSNQQRLDASTQEQTKHIQNIRTRNLIDSSTDNLKFLSFLESDYKTNQPKIFNVNRPRNYKPKVSPIVIPLREWEGYVVEIAGDTFIAKLVDVKNNSKLPKESGKFKISMLSLEDQNELQLGSIIRWKIDKQILSSGQPQNVSKVALIDTPKITEEVIENAYKYAAEMTKRLTEIETSS